MLRKLLAAICLAAAVSTSAAVQASDHLPTARSELQRSNANRIDFKEFEGLSRSGRGAETKAFLDAHFPPGSPVEPAIAAAKAGGAKCFTREYPPGGIQHACRKYITPPLKETFLGAIDWNITVIENPNGVIERISIIRSTDGP